MAKEKLLILTHLFPTPWKPNQAAFNFQRFSSLAKNLKVDILVPVRWTQYFNSKELVQACENVNQIRHFPFIYIPLIFRSSHALFMLACIYYYSFKWVKKRNYTCVFISWAFPDAVAGILLAKMLKLPCVISVEGSDINCMTKSFIKRKQIMWALKSASHVFCVSKALQEKVRALGVSQSKCSVAYNGVNDRIFYPVEKAVAMSNLKYPKGRMFILFVGNLIKTKGCAELIEAFAFLSSERKNLDLYFLGDGSYRDYLERLTRKKGLTDRVYFIGSKNYKDVSAWMNAASLVCLPSYSEGLPNVLLESMSCATPVVASAVGGVPEIINCNNGILLKSLSICNLVIAINECLDKEWNEKQMLNEAKKYSWLRNRNEIESVIYNITRNENKKITGKYDTGP